jgi:asparagine synthase (glutamine-hydrolysing)
MCGIAGLCRLAGEREPDCVALEAMTAVLAHRGPDAQGTYAAGPIALGHRRLSIIDLQTGDQPLSNEDDTVWTVFNGEIYNHIELRRELEATGHVFKTASDTEVIVHQYEEDGAACVDRLRGMFSFAVWDERRRELMLARDRFGKKPFFIAQRGDDFAFASEMKSLLELQWVDRSWDAAALRAFLLLGYVPGTRTVYRGVRKLAAGTVETWRLGTTDSPASCSAHTYWRPSLQPRLPAPSFGEAKERLLELLVESVRLRLRSDVPLGAFLSGGVDSTAVVALMRLCGAADIRSFSVGFEQDRDSELPYAEQAARAYETDHHSHVVTSADARLLADLLRGFDEPFADDSAIPTYFVSALARQHVKVALSGDGGDELFAGYTHYPQVRRLARFDRVPDGLREALSRAGVALVPRSARGGRFVRDLGVGPERRTMELALNPEFDLSPALCPEFREFLETSAGDDDWRSLYVAESSVAGMQLVDQRTYLVDDILVKVDRCSMATSLEARVPLLDHVLAEYVNGLPTSYKLAGSVSKKVFRETMRPFLPESTLTRPKRGFGMPLRSWLRGPLRHFAEEALLDPASRLFDEQVVLKILDGDSTSMQNWERRVWLLLSLGAWAGEQATRPW